jgi:hypothetical protein
MRMRLQFVNGAFMCQDQPFQHRTLAQAMVPRQPDHL